VGSDGSMPPVQRLVFDRDFSLPRDRVFDCMAEHENLSELFGAKVRRLCDGTDGHRNGVGSARELRVGPLPPFEETVTEFVPGELIRYRITKGSPMRGHDATMRFSTNGSGTHLHYEISFGAALPGLAPLLGAVLQRSIASGLGRVDDLA
jgi:uncharacterized protein YndB with AHSA1/START domain